MAEKDKGSMERMGEDVGGIAGKAADTAVDLMGSMIRTAASTFGGWWTDRSPEEAVRSFSETEDSSCRAHFQNNNRGGSYDKIRPLYQFGHLAGSNPDYQGRPFEEVEPDLQAAWTGDQARQYGDWSTVRDYISTGYARKRPE